MRGDTRGRFVAVPVGSTPGFARFMKQGIRAFPFGHKQTQKRRDMVNAMMATS